MWLVICALPKRWIIKGNKPLIDDSGFTVKALRGEFLTVPSFSLGEVTRRKCSYLVIIKMTVGFTSVFIRRHVLEELVANRASEATRMPSYTHRTYYSSHDRSTTTTAKKTSTLRHWRESPFLTLNFLNLGMSRTVRSPWRLGIRCL